MNVWTKTCVKCKTEKKIQEFCYHPHYKDGYTSACKECMAKSRSNRRKRRYTFDDMKDEMKDFGMGSDWIYC